MSTPAKPFEWRLNSFKQKTIIHKEEEEVEIPAFLLRKGTSGVPFVQFPSLYQDFIISFEDIIKRIDDGTYQSELKKDFDQGTITCSLFNLDGTLISAQDLHGSRMVRSLGQIMKSSSKGKLEEYRRRWIACFDGALDVAESKHATPGTFDVLNRFYLPNEHVEFRLCLMPGKLPNGLAVTDKMLEWCIEVVKKNGFAKSIQPIVYKSDPATAQANQMIQISTNPLGFYSTWIEMKGRDNLDILVKAQTSGDSWVRTQPTKDQVDQFSKNLFKPDTTFDHDTIPLVQFPGDNLFHHKRTNTKDIMGDSANQWAVGTLGWKGAKNEVCAEWLHIIAHRFWPGATDNFQNLIFGTKECNTDMMRAEAAVTQLLVSGKVYGVGITATTRYNLKEVQMLNNRTRTDDSGLQTYPIGWLDPKIKDPFMHPRPHWLTGRLEYEIAAIVPDQNKNGHIHRTKHVFSPFSRQRPFRFEYELDKVFLDEYLRTVDMPTDGEMEDMRAEIVKKLSGK
ncbi:betaine lipid synthase [Ceratobasidium sp. AG-Ba]|nr:betaine lipid synthase [Ceratobasidium sp. AG-Ba]